jgi:hypothetical protein
MWYLFYLLALCIKSCVRKSNGKNWIGIVPLGINYFLVNKRSTGKNVYRHKYRVHMIIIPQNLVKIWQIMDFIVFESLSKNVMNSKSNPTVSRCFLFAEIFTWKKQIYPTTEKILQPSFLSTFNWEPYAFHNQTEYLTILAWHANKRQPSRIPPISDDRDTTIRPFFQRRVLYLH